MPGRSPAATAAPPREPWGLLVLTATMLAAAMLPCVVGFSPQVWFDVDPRSPQGQAPITVLGPSPQAWYHVGVTALAAACLAYHLRQGGRIRWLATLGVVAGMAFTAWHLPDRLEGMIRGSGWMAAAALALAALHLTAYPLARRLVAAAMIALLVPLALEAFVYVWIEHPLTVDMFRRDEAQFLAARGWSEGSPQHLLYVRRLMFPDATGAFGLSNVFGSVLAAFSVAALAGAWCRRRDRLGLALCMLCAVAGAAALYLTHSKGAAGAFGLGVLVLILALSPLRRILPLALVLVVCVPLAAVGLRASWGLPADHTGERSLLFRWQYWTAATRIVADHPLAGVGPGGFKDAYLLAKDPYNPEDVTSAHSMFIDWVAMLGVGGWAWTAVMIAWLMQAGRRLGAVDAIASPGSALTMTRASSLAVLGMAAGLFGVQYTLELPQWVFETALLWMLGVLVFVGVGSILALTPGEAWPRLALLGSAAVLMVQGQIEMTFFQESSAMTAWFVAAASAGYATGRGPALRPPRIAWLVPLGLLVTALMLAVFVAWPLHQQQRHLARAATFMRMPAGQDAALNALEAAGRALSNDSTPWLWRAQLLLEQAAARPDPRAALSLMDAAVRVLREASISGRHDLKVARMLAQTLRMRAELTGHDADWDQALTLMREVVARNPYGLQDRLALADLWWTARRLSEATGEYQRVLVLHEQAYLDPFRQLSASDLERVKQRLGEGEKSP